MKSNGLYPSVSTYSLVIYELSVQTNVSSTHELFEDAKSEGYEFDEVIYSGIIDGFNRFFQVQRSCDVFDEVFCKCFMPKTYKWNSSLATLLKYSQIEHARSWFQLMKRITSIDLETGYNIMIDGLCMHKKFNKCLILWQEMHELGLKPNFLCYTTVIAALVEVAKIIQEQDLLDDFKNSGGCPYGCWKNN